MFLQGTEYKVHVFTRYKEKNKNKKFSTWAINLKKIRSLYFSKVWIQSIFTFNPQVNNKPLLPVRLDI